MTATLGMIERISDLRTVWKNEEKDFSKWLFKDENMQLLSQAIGIDLIPEETESSVGSFSVDILASEEGTGRKVIIENQLEDTNHDHLGKLITYAAGKEAEVIIWIVKRARDEHSQAIAWLNQHTDENIGIFLIEIELWKIGDSLPAVKFNVVEKPNDWAKNAKISDTLTPHRKALYSFWGEIVSRVFAIPEFKKEFSERKISTDSWYSLAIGQRNFHLQFIANSQEKWIGCGLYFTDMKERKPYLDSVKEDLEKIIGETAYISQGESQGRLVFRHPGTIKDESKYDELASWLAKTALGLKKLCPDIENRAI